MVVVLAMILMVGCSFWILAPMDVLTYKSKADNEHRNLFVFLRGLGASHTSFEKEGMVDEVRAMDLPFDMVAPNAHFGYYSKRTLITRLKEDVIEPARNQGYQNIWLVGVSMGGLGSLLYLRERPEDIRGVYLIAPFLGYDPDTQKIIKEGGVRQWNPGEYEREDDWHTMLWEWIKSDVAKRRTAPVYLGYGDGDKYITGQQLLAETLPSNHVTLISGGHTYATFKTLWKSFLDSRVFLEP